jgi:hypothetical protein
MDLREKLIQRLDAWMETFKDQYKQHTEGWLAGKMNTFGGSEMATILGVNPHESIVTTILRKAKKLSMSKNWQMCMGNLFESILRDYTAYIKDTKIVGHELWIPGKMECLMYSPDGFGIVKLNNIWNYEEGSSPLDQEQWHIVLFEFKCTFDRVFKNSIPDYYVPQIMTGLDTINIATAGLYTEGMFKRCSWEDCWNSPTYTIEPDEKKKPLNINPLAYGVIGFYSTGEKLTEEQIMTLEQLESMLDRESLPYYRYGTYNTHYFPEFTDLGVIHKDIFHHIIKCFGDGVICCKYSSIQIVGKTEVDEWNFHALCNYVKEAHSGGRTLYGILPWKLFRVDFHPLEREEGWVEKHRGIIEEADRLLKRCQANPDDTDFILAEYVDNNIYSDE